MGKRSLPVGCRLEIATSLSLSSRQQNVFDRKRHGFHALRRGYGDLHDCAGGDLFHEVVSGEVLSPIVPSTDPFEKNGSPDCLRNSMSTMRSLGSFRNTNTLYLTSSEGSRN